MKTNTINNLPIQKKINLEKVPKPYREVAEGMETQFINHMLGEMRKSIQKTTPDSSSEAYYNSLLDYERSQMMAKNADGIGIKEVVLRDLMPKHLLDRVTETPIKNNKLETLKGQKTYNKIQGDHE